MLMHTVTRQNNVKLKWDELSSAWTKCRDDDGNSPFFAISDVIEFDMSVCCVRSHYHFLSSSRTAASNNSAQPVTQHRLSPYLVSARLYQLGAGDSPLCSLHTTVILQLRSIHLTGPTSIGKNYSRHNYSRL